MKKKRIETDELEDKLDILAQRIHRIEIMSTFAQRPEKVDPIKLETAIIAMGVTPGCVNVKCTDCNDIQQKACLISARRKFLRKAKWRMSDDEYTNTILELLADCEVKEDETE